MIIAFSIALYREHGPQQGDEEAAHIWLQWELRHHNCTVTIKLMQGFQVSAHGIVLKSHIKRQRGFIHIIVNSEHAVSQLLENCVHL